MRTIKTLIPICVLLTACGSSEPDLPETFHEGALDMSVAFCERSVECGARLEEEVGYCVEANVYNLCVYWDCEAELTPEEQEMFVQCTADLEVRECGAPLSQACFDVLSL